MRDYSLVNWRKNKYYYLRGNHLSGFWWTKYWGLEGMDGGGGGGLLGDTSCKSGIDRPWPSRISLFGLRLDSCIRFPDKSCIELLYSLPYSSPGDPWYILSDCDWCDMSWSEDLASYQCWYINCSCVISRLSLTSYLSLSLW